MTYPICIACGAHILDDANHRNLDDGRATHYQCPEVEDLDALPLVERAAIACSMCACDGYEFTDDAPMVTHYDAAQVVGDDVHDLINAALEGVLFTEEGSMAFAIAESLLRNGEVAL